MRDFVSLNGTIVNCAGGPTPWGSWLSCEESVDGSADGWEQEHGYIFEVPAAAEAPVRPVPLKAMGRFVHEAVAVDRATGIVYETEDRTPTAGFYRFIPASRDRLAEGGRLQMLAVEGRPTYDTAAGQQVGAKLPARWVDIRSRIPRRDAVPTAVFEQGFAKGARGSPGWRAAGTATTSIYFHATNGGDAQVGQVWRYRPTAADRGELSLVFESPSREVLDYPDNITVSPRGGIVMCEDGEGEQFVRGLTPEGRDLRSRAGTCSTRPSSPAPASVPMGRCCSSTSWARSRDADALAGTDPGDSGPMGAGGALVGRQAPGRADLGGDDPPPLAPGGRQQPFQRLLHRLAAQPESRVVHRQQVLRAEIAEHAPRLLGRGVIGDPGVVGADRENREIDLARRADSVEHVGVGGVAREQHGAVPPGSAGTRRSRGGGR